MSGDAYDRVLTFLASQPAQVDHFAGGAAAPLTLTDLRALCDEVARRRAQVVWVVGENSSDWFDHARRVHHRRGC